MALVYSAGIKVGEKAPDFNLPATDGKNYPFPYLRDKTQEVAKTYKAVCTPDIFVLDSQRKMCYNGRLDDNWQDQSKVSSNDLARALDTLLANKKIDFKVMPSMGCSIKWLS